MVNQFLKKKSKRVSTRLRTKIERKVKEHKRKLKKEAKKNPNKGKRKDPGIPNSCPFKEEVLKEAELRQIRLQEEREKEKERRKRERQQQMNKSRNLESIVKDAQRRGAEFERKKAFVSDNLKDYSAGKSVETSLKAYYKEFSKVIEASDVVLQVLDARDPLGSRCPQVEEAVLSAGANKRLVLVLNKIDLVPKENVESWLRYLRNEFPTVAFKASTQTQADRLSQSKVSISMASEELKKTSTCLGADLLMKLLGNYCRKKDIKTAITVGVVGFPNTGKSSLINSLKRSKACNVGATPGVTKTMQAVKIDKHVKLLDSPGIVMATSMSDASTILRNCVKIETLEDPSEAVSVILKRCSKQQVMFQYNIPDFKDTHEFLCLLAQKMGRLKKGGIPQKNVAARRVLQDWNTGKITYYTCVPEDRSASSQISAEIVSQMSAEFDIDSLLQEEENTLSGLRLASENDVIMESSGPTDGVVSHDAEMEEEEENEDGEEAEETGGEDKEEMGNVKVTVDAGRSRQSSTSSQIKEKEKKLAREEAGNLQLNAARKKAFKKMKKDRKRRDKVAGNLSDALSGALSGLGQQMTVDDSYSFSSDFN